MGRPSLRGDRVNRLSCADRPLRRASRSLPALCYAPQSDHRYAVRKSFALSSVSFPSRPAVTYPQVLHQAIDCFAFGTRSAQANCFNHARIFRGTTLRTSRRFIFHEAPNLSLAMMTYLPLSALVLGALAGSPGCTEPYLRDQHPRRTSGIGHRPAPIAHEVFRRGCRGEVRKSAGPPGARSDEREYTYPIFTSTVQSFGRALTRRTRGSQEGSFLSVQGSLVRARGAQEVAVRGECQKR